MQIPISTKTIELYRTEEAKKIRSYIEVELPTGRLAIRSDRDMYVDLRTRRKNRYEVLVALYKTCLSGEDIDVAFLTLVNTGVRNIFEMYQHWRCIG